MSADTRAAALQELADIDAPLLDADHIPQPEPGQVWVEPATGRQRWVKRVPTDTSPWMIWYRKQIPDVRDGAGVCLLQSWMRWARRTGARPEVRGILVELSDEQLSAALTDDGSETSGDLTTFRARPEALK